MLKTTFKKQATILNYYYRYAYFSSQIRKGLYAGSFDPPSNGHLDIITRGLTLCDKLYVGVATNAMKKYGLDMLIRLKTHF